MNIPKYLCGGIGAGEWCKVSFKKIVKEHYLARCNNVVIESMAPLYSSYDEKTKKYTADISIVYPKLSAFLRTMESVGDVWVTLHLVNGGDGMLTQYGADAIIEHVLKPLAKEFPASKSHIIICPIAEMHGEPGEQQLVLACIELWANAGGHLMFNGTGRPTSLVPGHDILDYHSQKIDDPGPKIGRMSLVDTDNGPIIDYLKYGAAVGKYWNTLRVTDMADRCKRAGNGLNLYAFNTTYIDRDALCALGKMYAVRPEPSFLDKLIMRLKLLFA